MTKKLALTACVCALLGCEDTGPPNDPAGPQEIPDSDPAERPRPGDATVDRIVELAGTWHAHADTDDYGRVNAELLVDDRGAVTYHIVGEGETVTGALRIVRWDGHELAVRDRDGREYGLRAYSSNGELTATLPIAGEVVFRRSRGPQRTKMPREY